MDIDGGPAVAKIEGCRGQTAQPVGNVCLPGAEVGGGCESGIRHGSDHDDSGRAQAEQGGLLARQRVIEDQLQAEDDEQQRPEVTEAQQRLGGENPDIGQQNDGADRDQQQRDQQTAVPVHRFLAAANQYQQPERDQNNRTDDVPANAAQQAEVVDE